MGAVALVGGVDDADGAGAPGGQPPGTGIGPVSEPRRRFGDASPRRLVDLGVTIQSTADCRLRQTEIARQLLEVHAHIVPGRRQSGSALHHALREAPGFGQSIAKPSIQSDFNFCDKLLDILRGVPHEVRLHAVARVPVYSQLGY